MRYPFAIKFSDNDFGNTFMPLMKALGGTDFNGTKEELLLLINETIYSFYLIYQCNGHLPVSGNTKNYLKLSMKELLIKNEVDEFFKDDSKMRTVNHDFYYYYPSSGVGVI